MDHLKPNKANSPPFTPLGFLERAATVYGDCPSIVYDSTTYTWSDTYSRCLRISSSIMSLGIGRGHVVSVLAPNIPAMYELQFGVPMSGAILNNINIRLNPRTISVLIRHSETKLVFVDYQLFGVLVDALAVLPPTHPRPKLVLIEESNNNADEIQTQVNINIDQYLTTYEEMIKKGDSQFKWVRPESEWDPIVLNYTSGTTSAPKGVVHSHRGAFIMSMDALVDWSVPKQPIYLWTLPMFHANGWSFTWGMAAVGATNICLRKFDGPTVHAAIRQYNITHMCGAPVILNMLSNQPNPTPLRRPVHLLTAGAPPPAAVLLRTESLGFIISHGYGLTETGGLVISCAWKPHWNKFPALEKAKLKARQGVRTLSASEVDIIDPETQNPVPKDGKTVGEVVLRGGFLMLGYLKDPIATKNCMGNDGWFKTGDVGVMHTDGYLEIKDRSKDIIISGGENISSVEVESVLYTFPEINEAAVVAKPDEYWGETPCAFVSLKDGVRARPTEKDVIEYCRGKLPHYMVPKTVVFKDELPKTSTGKIKKFVLREIAKGLDTSKGKGSRL
ncbi:2-methylpropanoate--CoA ligase CCL4-like [Silene latifolia]|uniref:2-methylpropanoate--CoA ligase CCL4-like n=1 Tax=Silene latifolia TaxID=37657 RepID=UPI003D7772D9